MRFSKKYFIMFEIVVGLGAIAFLVYLLRSMLLYSETTLVHDNIYGYPYFQYFAENIINGSYPFWNPFSHGGEPLYPILSLYTFYEPISLLVIYIGSFITDDIVMIFNWHKVVKILFSLLGVYFVLRLYTKYIFIQITLIPIMLYSSFLLVSFHANSTIRIFLWVPWITYFLLRIIWHKDCRWFNWIVLASLIGLNWQSYWFAGTWTFLLFFFLGVSLFRRDLLKELFMTKGVIPRFLVMSVIVLFMMAPNIVLLLEKGSFVFPVRMMKSIDDGEGKTQQAAYLQYEGKPSNIVEGIIMPYSVINQTGTFSTIWGFIQLISPDGNKWIGWPDMKRWGKASESYMYLGLLPWAIAILGMVMGRHDLKRLWLLILVGFGLMMLGPSGGLHRVLYYAFPPIWFIRHTHLFVLFFLFAFLYFYVLGFNFIFSTWHDYRPLPDAKRGIRKLLSIIIFSSFIVVSIYWMTRLEYPQTDYLFVCFVLIFIVGWLFRKSLGKKGLYISIIISHLALVVILTANRFRFCMYTLLAFGIPLLLYLLYVNIRTNISDKSKKNAMVLILIVFTVCLTGDLIYSLKQSRNLFLGQLHPGLAYNINTKVQEPFLPQERLIMPDSLYGTTGQSLRGASLVYRQPYVFSPLYVGEVAKTDTFEDALKSKRWNSLLLLKNYFYLINSGISPLVMEEMFAVDTPMIQFKKGAVLMEDTEVFISLKGLGSEKSVQLLQDYVLVDRQSGLSLRESGILAEDYENLNQLSTGVSKTTHDITKKDTFTYDNRQDRFLMSENYCSTDLDIETSSMHAQLSPVLLCDGDPATFWHISLNKLDKTSWVKVDFGEGNEKIVNYLMAQPRGDNPSQFFRNSVVAGSNDDKRWEKIASISQATPPETNKWISWCFPNEKPYRYYKLYMLNGHTIGRFYSFAGLRMYNRVYLVNIDLGEGNQKAANYMSTKRDRDIINDDTYKGFYGIKGSNDRETWEEIAAPFQEHRSETDKSTGWRFPNDKPYRYYKLYIFDGHTNEHYYSSGFGELRIERNTTKRNEFNSSIKQNGYNSFDMKVVSEEAGLLYWADGYDKWWEAYINGKEVPVYRANYNFKAIALPKGENNVSFVYNPVLFKVALFVFYGVFIISIVAALVVFRKDSTRYQTLQ
jgi:hypothetical protein